MLKSISCDKFISNGKVREPIIFHNGLNTVLGSPDAKNSIGKSTLLMIIDFVFGGTDYLNKKTKDVIDNVGHHTINFSFEFEGKQFYMSRSTENPNFVNYCNSDYSIKRTVSLDEFNKRLAIRYGLDKNDISLRDAVGRFFRVYHRETTDEHQPLKAANREPVNVAITALIKLFDAYKPIVDQEQIRKKADDESKSMNKARSYNQVKSASNKTEFDDNNKRIEQIETQLDELLKETQRGLTDIDAIKAEELAEIKRELSILRRQRTQLTSQLNAMEGDKDFSKKNFKHDYDALREFFPEANYQALEKVEEFHSKLSKILKKEFKEKTDEIKLLLSLINEEIVSYQERAKKIETTPDLSKAILIRFAELTKSLQTLKNANNNYVESERLKEIAKSEKEKYENLIKETITNIQNTLNTIMKEYTDYIYSGTKTSPQINLIDSSRYTFFTPNDTGTGSLLRSLVTFDLAILNTTNLPAVIHDTVILKHIDDETLEKLIKLYTKTQKQVFIAFDRDTTYSTEMQTILRSSRVIKLSSNGNELFGRAWNEVKEEE